MGQEQSVPRDADGQSIDYAYALQTRGVAQPIPFGGKKTKRNVNDAGDISEADESYEEWS